MLYGSSKVGVQKADSMEPSMLGAAVRVFPVNAISFDLAMVLLQHLDAEAREKLMSATDERGSSALMDACIAMPPSITLVRTLLAAGAQTIINATDAAGRTALMLAAGRDFAEAVDRLLESGCDVEQRDRSGRTALQHACGAHASRATAILLASDASLDARTLWSCAPLITTSFVRWHASLAPLLGYLLIGFYWMLANNERSGGQWGRALQWLRELRDWWLRFAGADQLVGKPTKAGELPETRGHQRGRQLWMHPPHACSGRDWSHTGFAGVRWTHSQCSCNR